MARLILFLVVLTTYALYVTTVTYVKRGLNFDTLINLRNCSYYGATETDNLTCTCPNKTTFYSDPAHKNGKEYCYPLPSIVGCTLSTKESPHAISLLDALHTLLTLTGTNGCELDSGSDIQYWTQSGWVKVKDGHQHFLTSKKSSQSSQSNQSTKYTIKLLNVKTFPFEGALLKVGLSFCKIKKCLQLKVSGKQKWIPYYDQVYSSIHVSSSLIHPSSIIPTPINNTLSTTLKSTKPIISTYTTASTSQNSKLLLTSSATTTLLSTYKPIVSTLISRKLNTLPTTIHISTLSTVKPVLVISSSKHIKPSSTISKTIKVTSSVISLNNDKLGGDDKEKIISFSVGLGGAGLLLLLIGLVCVLYRQRKRGSYDNDPLTPGGTETSNSRHNTLSTVYIREPNGVDNYGFEDDVIFKGLNNDDVRKENVYEEKVHLSPEKKQNHYENDPTLPRQRTRVLTPPYSQLRQDRPHVYEHHNIIIPKLQNDGTINSLPNHHYEEVDSPGTASNKVSSTSAYEPRSIETAKDNKRRDTVSPIQVGMPVSRSEENKLEYKE